MHTSKAFRCTLPGVRDDQVSTLRRWFELHCAQSTVFRSERGCIVLVGLKDEFRTSASFARTVRTALRRLCIHVPLRGRWCSLLTTREALSICMADNGQRCTAPDAPKSTRAEGVLDEDIRVVTIQGLCSRIPTN